MRAASGSIVGRELELAVARELVNDVTPSPASLVLEGAAGIGKTAIWSTVV